jgi:WD40 repeat protein
VVFVKPQQGALCSRAVIFGLVLALWSCSGEPRKDSGDLVGRASGRPFRGVFEWDGDQLLSASHLSPQYLDTPVLWDLRTGRSISVFPGHSESVWAVALSPDRRSILTGGGRESDMGRPSAGNEIRLWDASSGRELRRFEGHKEPVRALQFLLNGTRILSLDHDGTAKVWDTESGKERFTFSDLVSPSSARSLSVSLDCRRIAGLTVDGNLKIWDAGTGKQEECVHIEGENQFSGGVELSPDGTLIATVMSDRTVRIWESESARLLLIVSGHTGHIHEAIFSPDARWLVSCSEDTTVRIWETLSGRELKKLRHPGPVTEVRLSLDGGRLLSKWNAGGHRSHHRWASLWDVQAGIEIKRIGKEGSREVVGFSPDGKTILLTASGKPAFLLDALSGEVIREYK